MNAPAWFRCGHCIWWKASADPGEGHGCLYTGTPKPTSYFYRCHLWTCKRCFAPWNATSQCENDIINHLFCLRLGRSKPERK